MELGGVGTEIVPNGSPGVFRDQRAKNQHDHSIAGGVFVCPGSLELAGVSIDWASRIGLGGRTGDRLGWCVCGS